MPDKRTLLIILAGITLSGCGPSAFVIRPVPADQSLRETELTAQSDRGFLILDKIAVIDVDGIISNSQPQGIFNQGDNPASLFLEKLHRAQRDHAVKAVVLRLNSPGGTVAGSDIMYHALQDFRQAGKPVVACMLDVAASGAYYLACGCDRIIAQPTTVTGSIGTMLQTVSFAGTMLKLGIKAEAIKSREFKDIGSPLRDLRPAERAILQGIITKFYEDFLTVVLAGRSDLTRDRLLELADGRVFTADRAQQHGLIDRIGYPNDAIAWAKQLAGIPRAKVVIYSRPIGYKPTVYSSAGTSDITSLINVELPQWLRSQGPQFLYLWAPGLD